MSTSANLKADYLASRAQTKSWISSAKSSIALRNATAAPAGPANFVQRFAWNYGRRHVHTNSAAPLAHIILFVGFTGLASAYFGRNRHKIAAKAAAHGDNHDAHHH